ncbi:hypothetical protein TrST_g1694 [Triparma strigata]|uniref:Uncharacterized protein n=1 Tax=Triparma strigata TaxID=1606541 RepID=A0A9W6ZJ34_9STRA|nr:hypothetical protein TrST_g1694 [Triparma strigata]
MMTFLPFSDFAQSASVLDMRRLQNQRTEARFALAWIDHTEGGVGDLSAYGAARMWVGFRDALALYYNAMLDEYERRGKKNGPTLPKATASECTEMPPWLGDERFHASHRAVLLAKDHSYYSQFGWAEDHSTPDWGKSWEYLYPTQLDGGVWGLYPQSKYKKREAIAICHKSDLIAVDKGSEAFCDATRLRRKRKRPSAESTPEKCEQSAAAETNEKRKSRRTPRVRR